MLRKTILSVLVLFLISSISALKIDIVDEDYIEVEVGSDKKPLKLVIDPTSPFSYLIKKVDSKTKETFSESFAFHTIYGKFEGNWEKDYFYLTSDKAFTFKLKYLQVKSTDSVFNADGVIGLGFSKQIDQDCSIFSILGKMSDVFELKNAMSYDKAKKTLLIGEIPRTTGFFNKVSFPVFEGKKEYPATFVNLTDFAFSTLTPKNKTLVSLNATAKLGLMEVIVAPSKDENFLKSVYFPEFTPKVNEHKDKEKFFVDYYLDETNKKKITEMVFGEIAYKFDHDFELEGKIKSNIRLGVQKEIDFWYVGIDLLGVSRADFDYENNTVTLYSTNAYNINGNKYFILLRAILFCIIVCILISTFVRCCCQKKKQKDIKDDYKLDEL